jgi:hypothetical protein
MRTLYSSLVLSILMLPLSGQDTLISLKTKVFYLRAETGGKARIQAINAYTWGITCPTT